MRGETGRAGGVLPLRGQTSTATTQDTVLIGESEAFATVKLIAEAMAPRQCTVMVLGQTGTGKEQIARYLHERSPRREHAFVPVDCSALADALFESQLFGHVRGAFTGAIRDTLGFIRAADGGTLFLDEIGELSLPLQAKLLRVIQERCVTPVGDTRSHPVDLRIIAATHRDLPDMVRRGEFREDLYFRLNVVTLRMPSLRQRREDVIPLAEHFLRQQADLYDEPCHTLSADAAELLCNYAWPGNVRELANAMERAHALGTRDEVRPHDLPPSLTHAGSHAVAASDLCLELIERRTIVEALRRTHNNKAAAARLLGLNVQRLNRRISSLSIPLK